MDELAARFRRGSQQRKGLRYPEELRRLAVEYSRQAARAGRSRRQISSDLGLSEWSLARWVGRGEARGRQGGSPVHEVAVVESSSAVGPVLVMASGVRVEGLSLSSLVAVLRGLS
jgi:hypothetical protein